MNYVYNKLVRDKIPEEINSEKGRHCNYRILNDEEYSQELDKKLFEEAHEFIEEHNPKELADLMEVIFNIASFYKISMENVENLRLNKNYKKGSFKNRIYLIDVNEEKRNYAEEKELNKEWRRNPKDYLTNIN